MKFGFISDVHGNYDALKVALEILNERSVDFIYSAGDIVGYGPEPEKCVLELRKHSIQSVMGNHDFAVSNLEEESKFNAYAQLAIQWTRDKISEDTRNFLKCLPFSMEGKDFTIFHGSLGKQSSFDYIIVPEDAILSFNNMNTKIGFFGHSHIAGCFIRDKNGFINFRPAYVSCTLKLKEENRYLINVGSVGQPRDGNSMGSLAIFDTTEKNIDIVRFTYDVNAVYKKIVDAQLPRFLGERLFNGV